MIRCIMFDLKLNGEFSIPFRELIAKLDFWILNK